MKFNSIIFLFIVAAKGYSQDTLHFLNKTFLAVKVQEIGIDDIRYRRIDNLEGPLYIANKKDIHYIKFSNGHVDSVTVSGALRIVSEPISISKSSSIILNTEKILIFDNKLSYMGRAVGESRLYKLVSSVPDQDKRALLLTEYGKMKSYKKKQYLFGFVGLGAGVAVAYAGFISSVLFDDEIPILAGLAAGATLGITGAVLSGINKSKRTKKRLEIADLYNH